VENISTNFDEKLPVNEIPPSFGTWRLLSQAVIFARDGNLILMISESGGSMIVEMIAVSM
jgi:hypothetical protein